MRSTVFKSSVILVLACTGTLLSQVRQVVLDGETYQVEEVFFDDFNKGLDNWQPEGDGKVRAAHGFLEVDSRFGDEGANTIWCVKSFSGPQLVEYDVRLMGDSYHSNVNMFLMASLPNGRGILATSDERTGDYGEYHQFPNYLITILNGIGPDKTARLRFRMRLDPGFELVEEEWHEPLVFGKIHHIAYLVRPPKISVFLDGKLLGKANYSKSLNRGLHGLRVWHTHSIYDNFRVSSITGK